jgi:transposase
VSDWSEVGAMLFVGDDWAEDHHDVEIVNEQGRRLARRRLPEGLDGVSRLHALIASVMPAEWADLAPADAADQVKIGIETDRGPWVVSLVAAGYEVFAINPMSTARYRQRHGTSGAKSDPGDAHVLAEIVRLDRDHHRPVAADSTASEAMKLVARSHQTMIWDRTRHVLRLRSALREYFPAALDAFDDLVGEHFGSHPDAKIYASQPGLGVILGARVLSEFGDDPDRYATAKARKNYAGTSPITRASGIKKTVLARHARNDRLGDAVHQWALGALRGSPGARAYYDAMRARNIGHHAALRQLGNRLVGILHGCLKTRTRYDENTAWAHHTTAAA